MCGLCGDEDRNGHSCWSTLFGESGGVSGWFPRYYERANYQSVSEDPISEIFPRTPVLLAGFPSFLKSEIGTRCLKLLTSFLLLVTLTFADFVHQD